MVVAMFLVKDLMIDWRLGEQVSCRPLSRFLALEVLNVALIDAITALPPIFA
jgi:hypothetical protein